MKVRIIFILFLSISVTSCGTWYFFNKRDNFDIYKEPINQGESFQLRTDGIYVQQGELEDRNHFRDFYIFYENGFYISGWFSEDRWVNNTRIIRGDYIYSVKDGYGVYSIKNNALRMDRFGGSIDSGFRWVDNFYAEVSEGSIRIYLTKSTTSQNYPDENINVTIKFYPTEELIPYQPTSWYLKKKWYIENFHPSRK